MDQAGPPLARLPHPKFRLPIAGDLLSVDSSKPVQREMKMADELGGIYERKIFGHRLVVVSDPILVNEVNNEKVWTKFLGLPHRKLRGIAGDGLFTAFNSEPNWQLGHSVLGPAFNKAAMRRYHESMQRSIDGLLATWDNSSAPESVDAYEECSKLAFDVIGRCAVSHDFGTFDGEVPFADAISRALRYVNQSSNDVPMVRALTGRSAAKQHTDDLATIRDTVDSLVESRMATRRDGEGNVNSDLLQHMFETVDPATRDRLSVDNIKNQIITFLVAGNETTASTMAFALHFLSRDRVCCGLCATRWKPSLLVEAQSSSTTYRNSVAFAEWSMRRYVSGPLHPATSARRVNAARPNWAATKFPKDGSSFSFHRYIDLHPGEQTPEASTLIGSWQAG